MARRTPAPGTRLALLAIALALIAIAAHAPPPPPPKPGGAGEFGEPAPDGSRRRRPFDRQGMWIWYVVASEGGNLPRIIAKARRSDIGTLYIKSGDGGDIWSQFNQLAGRSACTAAASTSAPGSSSTATTRSARPRSGPPRSAGAPTAW